MNGFDALLKRRDVDSIKATAEQIKNSMGRSSYEPEANFYKIKLSNGNTGQNVVKVRFLPQAAGSTSHIVQRFEHTINWYKGDQKKFAMFMCPTTMKGECPVCALNKELWAMGEEDIVRKRKRMNRYYANIYIYSDQNNPENNGKVFTYRVPKPIVDKLNNTIDGKFGEAFIPFDFIGGADVEITVFNNTGNFNDTKYDESSVSRERTDFLGGNINQIKEVYKQLKNLDEMIEPKKFEFEEKQIAFIERLYQDNIPRLAAKTSNVKNTEVTEEQKALNRKNSATSAANEKLEEGVLPFDVDEVLSEAESTVSTDDISTEDLMAQLQGLTG